MYYSVKHPVLRDRLGNDGFLELTEFAQSHGDQMQTDILSAAGDRVERRLVEETAKLRSEVDAARLSLIKWMFGFFIGYLGITISLAELILHATRSQ